MLKMPPLDILGNQCGMLESMKKVLHFLCLLIGNVIGLTLLINQLTIPAQAAVTVIKPVGYNIVNGQQDLANPINGENLVSDPGFSSSTSFRGTQSTHEKAIEEDTRIQITDTEEAPFRWIGRIQFSSPEGKKYTCTGSLIGKDTVITAGHCLARNASNISFTPGLNHNESPFPITLATQVWYDKNFNQKLPGQDWGIIKLDTPIGNEIGWFGMKTPTNTELEQHNAAATIIGYPGDKPADSMWRGRDKITNVTEQEVFYKTDTFTGQSGAPVLDDSDTIFAIHTDGLGDKNWGTRITPELFNLFINLSKATQSAK